MALSSGSDNLKTFYVKVQGLKKGSKEIYFEVKDTDKNVLDNQHNSLKGTLKDVRVDSYEYEGEKKNSLKFLITDQDAGEKYYLQMGLSSFSQGILNSLASADMLGEVELR